MNQLPFLTEIQYRKVLYSAFNKQGIAPDIAGMLVEARFPMDLANVILECSARGIDLTEADVDEFIWSVFEGPPPRLPNGSAMEAKFLAFDAELIDALLSCASAANRGTASKTSAAIAERFPVAAKIESVKESANVLE